MLQRLLRLQGLLGLQRPLVGGRLSGCLLLRRGVRRLGGLAIAPFLLLALALLLGALRLEDLAHPHVLQPLRRVGQNRVVAWSLGNFVFASHRSTTVRTGILHLDLSARGVERTRFQRARIDGVRPVLTGSWTGPR